MGEKRPSRHENVLLPNGMIYSPLSLRLGGLHIHHFEHCPLIRGRWLGVLLEPLEQPGLLGAHSFFDGLQPQQFVGGHVESLGEVDELRARRLSAGNITDIGNNRFLYDRVSRIKNFEFDSRDKQAYTCDVFGKLLTIATTPDGGSTATQSFPVAGLTNHLNAAGYHGAGNQTAWPGFAYSYDAFSMMTRMTGGGNDNTYVYTADDERLWTMDFTPGGGEAGTVHTSASATLARRC